MTYLTFFALSFAGGALAGALVALIVARRVAARAEPCLTERELLAAMRAFDQTRRIAVHARDIAQGAAFTARMSKRRGGAS